MKKLIILLIIIGIGLVLVFGGKLLKNTGLTNDEMVSKGFDWVTGKGTDELIKKFIYVVILAVIIIQKVAHLYF